MDKNLIELIELSHELGLESRGFAILGEGNTSTLNEDKTFWIKASGSRLSTIDESSFSKVNLESIDLACKIESMQDDEVAKVLQQSLVNENHRKPSVETFLHGLCYLEAGVKWVGHTHPISVNSILCSQMGAKPFLGHLFPDGIVVCGAIPAVLPYIDPGFSLALAFRDELRNYLDKHGHPPKMILMENHGLVALGKSASEVFNITLMADKWARIIQGTFLFGGPHYLREEERSRIDSRQDEIYRRKILGVV